MSDHEAPKNQPEAMPPKPEAAKAEGQMRKLEAEIGKFEALAQKMDKAGLDTRHAYEVITLAKQRMERLKNAKAVAVEACTNRIKRASSGFKFSPDGGFEQVDTAPLEEVAAAMRAEQLKAMRNQAVTLQEAFFADGALGGTGYDFPEQEVGQNQITLPLTLNKGKENAGQIAVLKDTGQIELTLAGAPKQTFDTPQELFTALQKTARPSIAYEE